MRLNFRRSPGANSTPVARTRHNGATPVPVESPRPPHAATVTPDEAFAAGYRYDPATIPDLYADAQEMLTRAGLHERQANNLLGEAARLRVGAADRLRLVALAELDAATPEGAAWPSPAPQVPQEPAPVYHFSDRVSFWPPCGARTEATWQTVNPAAVTCTACREHLAALQAPADADLLHGGGAWHPDTQQAAQGWDDPLPPREGDIERLPRVPSEVAR